MKLYLLFLTNGYSVRHYFVWVTVILGLIITAPDGYAKASKSVGIHLGVDKGSVESISVSTQTQSSEAMEPQSEPVPQPAPKISSSASNQSLQKQFIDLSMQVQQLMARINQQQIQINQQQAQINQLNAFANNASPQPTEPAKVYTCYIDESRNTFIGEGSTQVAAQARALSECKAARGWCKRDTIVCD